MFTLDLEEEVFFIHSSSIKKGIIVERFCNDSIASPMSISYAIETKNDIFTVNEIYIFTDIEQAAKCI